MDLNLDDYKYDLPQEKIAKYPLAERSKSKMLVYKAGQIDHLTFEDVCDQLPDTTHLVFNNTRVIPARIHFFKETGAKIEVFLLEPSHPVTVEEAMDASQSCTWKCLIGNAKRWKIGSEEIVDINNGEVHINRLDAKLVRFTWTSADRFSQIIQHLGKVPLPPYLNREAEDKDHDRYQTIYSDSDGAVAAPTAGLHFSKRVLDMLDTKGILSSFLTLHVSAGTFQPIKGDIHDHPMHREEVLVSRKTIESLLERPEVCAVGTTSLRTLESLYWYGVLLERDPNAKFEIFKNTPYEIATDLTTRESLQNVLSTLKSNNLQVAFGTTEIFIYPGYTFRIVKYLITNFHLPGSTLILLIAAFVGDDWETIYQSALENNYRFLSFGDSSLLIPGKQKKDAPERPL